MSDSRIYELVEDEARYIARLTYQEAKREGLNDDEAEALAMDALSDYLE